METNDAKREALEAFLRGYSEGKICAFGIYPSPETLKYLHSVVKKAQDALAQPRKNFEVGTPSEQYQRFKKYCKKKTGGCGRADRYDNPCAYCFSQWAQMPYNESKAENG